MSLLSDEEENLAQALEKDGKRTPASDLFRELTSPVFRYLYVKSSKKTDGEINSALIREAKKAQHAKDQEECQKRIEQVFEFLDKYQVIRPDKDSVSQFDPFISIPVTDIWELKAKIKEE